MGRWAWVPSPCPPLGLSLLLLLLLLLVPRGAQPQAGRNPTEPPECNATVIPGTPAIPVTSVTPRTPATATAPRAEGPHGGGLTHLPRAAPSNSSPGGTVLTEAGQPCRFPFRYGGRMVHSCTTEGSAHRKWCATTHNYDRDRAWGYCVQASTPREGPAALDPCASGPCLNGGSCSSTQDPESYHCTCPVAFTGKDCGTEKCFDESRYEYLEVGDRWARVHRGQVEQCECAGGQVRCQGTRHTACLSSPCLNGGTCHLIVATGTTVCACPPDHAGRLCNIVPAQPCFVGSGTEYRGVASTAASGLSCLAWNSDLLYQELHVDSVGAAALLGLGPHAYCRNPDKDERPWCYVVKDSALSWEYCRLAACGSLARIQPPPTEALLSLPGPAAAGPAGRQTCGKRHKKRSFLRPRIIGGSSSLPGSHPWLAAIYIGNSFCAGSLVHTCWVVSAAHCFSNSPPRESVSVVLGQHFFNRTTAVTQTFGIEKYIPYPLYSVFNPSDHDLVLIRLEKKGERCAVRSQFVQPICLPEPGSTFPAGHKCQIAGWGHQDENVSSYSSLLREALVPLVADHKCSSPEVYGADVSPNMLCAGYFDCRSDACQVSRDGRPGSAGPAGSTPRMGAHCCWRPGGQEWGPCSQGAGIEAREGPAPKAQARASCPAKGRAVHVTSKAKPLFTQSSPKWAQAIGRSQCPVSQGLLGSAHQC
ncbi:hepatocyte growth factor activator isoform X2 [Delphinapterus leucas]|uniref:Hepatocyte growth factor activator serine protease n=1 Tax=Delphinapterus leucas TaxID=9749 RepID=A0A2Y9LNZ2_DELLE|nr:hepatocyte growth factor activator isoform X2 [Delphinapterus leucas]